MIHHNPEYGSRRSLRFVKLSASHPIPRNENDFAKTKKHILQKPLTVCQLMVGLLNVLVVPFLIFVKFIYDFVLSKRDENDKKNNVNLLLSIWRHYDFDWNQLDLPINELLIGKNIRVQHFVHVINFNWVLPTGIPKCADIVSNEDKSTTF